MDWNITCCIISWTAVAVSFLAIIFVANRWRLPSLAKLRISEPHFSTELGQALDFRIRPARRRADRVAVRTIWPAFGGRSARCALSFTTGAIAVWLRSAEHVYFSGLLLNLAGVAAWFAWGEKNAANFLEFQVLCLSAAATIWTLIDILRRDCVPHLDSRCQRQIGKKPLPFAHLAIAVAMLFLAVPTVYGVFGDLSGIDRHDARQTRLDRLGGRRRRAGADALGSTRRYPWLGFYLTGIIALGMLWEHHHAPRPI